MLLLGRELFRLLYVCEEPPELRQEPGELGGVVPEQATQVAGRHEPDHLLQDLAPRDERRRLVLVGVTGERQQATGATVLEDLLGQARLAHPGLAAEQHQAALARRRIREHPVELGPFGGVADEGTAAVHHGGNWWRGPGSFLERRADLPGGLETPGRVLCEAALDHACQPEQQIGSPLRESRRPVPEDGGRQLGRRATLEGSTTGRHLVEDDA